MKYSEETKQKARELCAQGLSQREVGRRLGVPHPTIGCWVNPAVADRKNKRTKQYDQENREQVLARARERSQKWRQANPEKRREIHRKWYQANVGRKHEYSRKWAQANPERVSEISRKWRQANPEKVRKYAANRRARKLQATPPWLTLEHHAQIAAFYAEATRLEQVTGISHHVDHIVPLTAKPNGRGKQTACGLHVPWNLRVLPGSDNCVKNCKLPDPEHWTAPTPGGIIERSSGEP